MKKEILISTSFSYCFMFVILGTVLLQVPITVEL
jgi:hypothetical protein